MARVRVMAVRDTFCDIARYYDHIMDHVDYDRWFTVTTALAQLLPRNFIHLDAACGTGTLLKRLRHTGWRTIGVDLSPAMLRAGLSIRRQAPPAAAADLRALPFQSRIDYVTCLFDSVNFLLDMDDVHRMFAEVHGILDHTGLFYFDIVTERMVTQHFDNQQWTEQDGRFSTTWRSTYDRRTRVTATEVRVGTGDGGVFLERIYEVDEIVAAVTDAGLELLGTYDAQTWGAPKKRTTRIDFVAAKDPSRPLRKRFGAVRSQLRGRLA